MWFPDKNSKANADFVCIGSQSHYALMYIASMSHTPLNPVHIRSVLLEAQKYGAFI